MGKKESQTIEFKPNWRDEYLKVISAFANVDGGILFIGLDDKGNPVGFESTQKLLENIPRDYLGTSTIQIRVYEDRLVIMNEGKLPPEVPVEKLKTDHLSIPRNALLAKIFYFAGFIESWGRGTIKIVEDCLKQGIPEPDFIEEYGVMKVIFYKDRFTEEYLRKLGLSERQIKAVIYVKESGKITNREYQKLNIVSKPTATRDLEDLTRKSVLEKIGVTGKGTFYKIKGS